MAAIDVTKKLLIYHTLYRLNVSFSNIITHCRTLQHSGVFTAKSTRLFQGYAQELQAEMNHELLETMHSIELMIGADSGKSAKQRKSGSEIPIGKNCAKNLRNNLERWVKTNPLGKERVLVPLMNCKCAGSSI
jgi:hypothetical protein